MTSNYSGVIKQLRFWTKLGWLDIVSRYRATVLGVFWILLVNGMTVIAIGFVYSSLFGLKLSEYFPYLVVGYIIWLWISGSLVEISSSLTAYRFILHSHAVYPISVIVRVFVRNIIILLHNIPIIAGVLLLYGPSYGAELLLVIPGIILVSVFLISTSGISAFMCARFNDIQMLITAIVGILFLITPIIWSPDILTERAYIATLNPLTHVLDVLRKPLLGEVPNGLNYFVMFTLAGLSLALFIVVYRMYFKRYVFWL
ncbi:MAG: ABC transporter permease [Bacteroidetes bacterium]|nr:ABC transporter permease [Bacteroidota bacterium]